MVAQGINNDRSPTFVAKITQDLATVLGFEWQLHVPYDPQRSGRVERMNSAIKEKLIKTMKTIGLKRHYALSIVLYSI